MTFDDNMITFSSGRTAYCNRGIIGLDDGFNVMEGYDGSIWQDYFYQDKEDGLGPDIEPDDLIELADYMIERWIKFKFRAVDKKHPRMGSKIVPGAR